MDLFDVEAKEDGEWIDVANEIPNVTSGTYLVKYGDSGICKAYFCLDRISPLARAKGINPSYWWDKITKDPIHNVTHWMK